MLSSEQVRQVASTLAQGAVRPEGLATAGAVLTCVAVVLNVGPFVAGDRHQPVKLALAGETMPQAQSVAWRAASAVDPLASAAAAEPYPASAAEPHPALAREPDAPTLFWVASADVTRFAPAPAAGAAPEPQAAETDEAAAEARPASIVGVWSPDGGHCTARDFRDGIMPTVINAEGAWAGETFCVFTKRREIESGWRVVAKCSTPRARWTSNVRLTVNDNRLTWTSERGTQAYTRCATDTLMAQAR